jgi:hypothetical protein
LAFNQLIPSPPPKALAAARLNTLSASKTNLRTVWKEF